MNVHTAANPGGELRGQLAETVVQPPAPTANPTLPPTSTVSAPAGLVAGVPMVGFVLALRRGDCRARAPAPCSRCRPGVGGSQRTTLSLNGAPGAQAHLVPRASAAECR